MIRARWVLSILIVLLFAHVVSAASAGTISMTGSPGGADFCIDASLTADYSFTADTDDGGGQDWIAVAFADANGVPLDVEFFSYKLGAVTDSVSPNMRTLDPSPDLSGIPVSAGLFDIADPGAISGGTMAGYNFAISGTLLAQTNIDPTPFAPGPCEDYTPQPPFLFTSGGSSGYCPPIPDGSVVGALPTTTQAFWAPGQISPNVFVNAGTYWVLGEDKSQQFYKIRLACQYLWLPVSSMQPSFQSPWTGQPLPTQIVD